MVEENQAAPGVLASTLLAAAEGIVKTWPSSASSGIKTIDDLALHGGFRYGEVTSIAGASGSGKTLFAFHAIASHLLHSAEGDVAFIDTTGSFSPLRLRNVLASRLESQSPRLECCQVGYVYENRDSSAAANDDKLKEQATRLLDRVRVMRAFDFAGVIEALGEIGQVWEKQDDRRRNFVNMHLEDEKKVLYDSQDGSFSISSVEISVQNEEHIKGMSNMRDEQTGMIIIDTITNVVSSMVSRSQTQGQALLASFMRSLRHLTYRRQICSVLTNTAVGLNTSSNPDFLRKAQDNASIFAATVGKPALGKAYTYLIDTSIFLSTIPKTKLDAKMASRGGNAAGWKMVGVLEVLKDRFGAQEGRWATFEIVSEVLMTSSM
ncbi:hypothetical protein MMC07_007028 [Pseudocyphellaria aurata]|nr:hypothetical protein [Pseudocyphellaria aurata]